MLRKTCFLIAFCLSIASIYAQSSSGGVSNTAYAFNRTEGNYGIVSFKLDDFSSFEMKHIVDDDVRAAAFVEGSYYALVYVDGNPAEIASYDIATGNKETVMETTATFVDMIYDYSTRSLLLAQYDYPNSLLVKYDLTTKEFTTLCTFDFSMFAVAADLQGNIYTADLSGDIYKVNRETYELTTVASTGHNATTAAQRSLDFDMNTGKLYFLANGSWAGTYLFEIDPEAGTSTAIGGMQSNLYVGIYTGYTNATPESPAAPAALTVTPAADGSNKCELSWTCPTTAFNRSDIGTLTHATIYRDGVAVGTVKDVKAGQQATYTDNLAKAGTYTYKVTLSNEAGEGMFAIASE